MQYRKTVILSIVVVVCIFLAGFSLYMGFNHFLKNSPTTDLYNSSSFDYWDNGYLDNETYQLDLEYNQKRKNAESNADVTHLNEEFQNLWKEKMDIYCCMIEEHYANRSGYYSAEENAEMIEKSALMQDEWELFYEKQAEYHTDFLLSIYGSGSIVPIYSSEYELMLCRNRAVELYKFCRTLGVDVDAP